MSRAVMILCLWALTGCGDRRTFDQRFNDTNAELEQRARALDQNLSNELSAEDDGNPAAR